MFVAKSQTTSRRFILQQKITYMFTTKLFTAVNYHCSQQARVFVPGRPFQPCLIFVGKARSLPWSETPGYTLDLLKNVRLAWRNLPGTKTLAYYEHS